MTRVAVIDWRRKESGTSAATTEQGETVSSDIDQRRAVNEVQRAVATEAQSGSSSSFAGSVSAQAGVAVNTLLASGSASIATTATTALTAQFSAGSRNLSANSTNAISQRTAEKSQALRSRRQSVVREVSQSESEQMSTRILANYNRRHTLNVEYFEVLQKYTVKTELTGWERCLFVPLIPLDFSNLENLKNRRSDLISILKDLGPGELATTLLEAISNIQKSEEQKKKDLEAIQDDGNALAALLGLIVQAAAIQHIPNMAPQLEALRNGYNSIAARFPGLLPTFDIARDQWAGIQPRIVAEIQKRREEYQRKLLSYTIPIGEILNASRMLLSQLLWLRMDSYRIYRALESYKLAEVPLSRLIDPHPVGVFGNYLAFRWGFGRDDAGKTARDAFEKAYLKQDDTSAVESTVALPTSGVFAEAVLGRGEAAEEIDMGRYGKWTENQPPILPPDIDKLTSRDRARTMDLSAADFTAALAQLRATALADSSHIKDIVGGVTKGDMFRDMGGLEKALVLAEKVAGMSEKGATRAGDRAAEMQAKMLDTFLEVLNSDIGQAAAAEIILPGAGPVLLQEYAKNPATRRAPVKPANSGTPKPEGGANAAAGKPEDGKAAGPAPATPPKPKEGYGDYQ